MGYQFSKCRDPAVPVCQHRCCRSWPRPRPTGAAFSFYPPTSLYPAQPPRGWTGTSEPSPRLSCSVQPRAGKCLGCEASPMHFPLSRPWPNSKVNLPLDATEPGLAPCLCPCRAAAPSPAGGLALRDLPELRAQIITTAQELRGPGLQADES